MQYYIYGANSQNSLVSNQFSPESFQVVQQVYYSLEHLRTIYRHLPNIELLGSNIHRLNAIEPYLRDIQNISRDLNKLLNVEYNLEFLRDIQPRVGQVVQELENFNHKLNLFNTNSKEVLSLMENNIKTLEELYFKYENGLQGLMQQFKCELCETHTAHMEEMGQLHEETKALADTVKFSMPIVNKAVDSHNKFNLLLQHLKASDLITLAQFTGSEEDYTKALYALKDSERWGNDESLNRARLEKLKQERATKEAQ